MSAAPLYYVQRTSVGDTCAFWWREGGEDSITPILECAATYTQEQLQELPLTQADRVFLKSRVDAVAHRRVLRQDLTHVEEEQPQQQS